MNQKDIDVSIDDGVSTINASSKFEGEKSDKEGKVIHRERRRGNYVRSMHLASTSGPATNRH